MARKLAPKKKSMRLKSALRESAAQIKRGEVSSVARLRAIYRAQKG